jgi:hypothetical protein
MRVLYKAGIAAMALALFGSAPVVAQDYRWDANINGGWGITGAVLDDDAVLAESLGFDNNWQLGGQLGYWFNRTIGLRGNLSYTGTDFMQGDGINLYNDVNLWSGTADLLFRFIKPRREWSGAEWLPYAALGAGIHWVNPPGNSFIIAEEFDDDIDDPLEIEGPSGVPIVCRSGVCSGPSTAGFPGIGGIPTTDQRTFFLKEGSSFAGLIGLGVDLRLSPSFAFRFEVGDLMWDAKLEEVETRENFFSVVRGTGEVGNTVHQFYGTVGLNFPFGLEVPRTVAVAPAPPPPPPPPAPTTEQITVCVLDINAGGGLRTVNALRKLDTGDTIVVRNGEPTPLRAAVGTVPIAADASWFIRGEPLTIGADKTKLMYLSVGTPQTLAAENLAFLGTVDGMPVYADKSAAVSPLDVLGPNTDLSKAVVESKNVYTALDNVKTVYVPMNTVGCLFQPLERQAPVRK